ncbi:MAG TPA: NAD(P)/FAD-dependent oxidoreductase, partial [Caldimonas sp.]
MSGRARVLVVGCGFGGLEAVRALSQAPVEITLVDRTNHHLFQPLLYQVATAGLSAPAISAPIRHVLRSEIGRGNLTVLKGEVRTIDVAARTATLATGETLAWDHLIVAAGATHSYFGHDEWERHAPGLKTLADAFELRARTINAFENAERAEDDAERSRWLTFVVIGGGPTGVEMAGTMSEIAQHTLRREFRRIDPTRTRVLLLEGTARVLGSFVEKQSARARAQLERLGVEVRTGTLVTAIDAEGVGCEATVDGKPHRERIAARTVIWAAGVAASPLGAQLARGSGAALDRAGRVVVEPDLGLPGYPEISVVGDLASALSHAPGGTSPVPGVSPA